MTTFAPILRLTEPAESPADAPAVCDVRAATQRQARRLARLAIVLCLGVQVWLISAGHWGFWPQYTARYDLLARGFSAGQTNLPIYANPRHLALLDPYDPVANDIFRMKPGIPDSCLYDEKFYLYWGPVPSLLLMPARLFVDRDFRIGDQYLTFAFVQGMMLATAAILLRLQRRHFPDSPAWLPALGIVVAGLSTPLASVLTRAAIYEAAIVGGQCFLLTGIYCAWVAVSGNTRNRRAPITDCQLGTDVDTASEDGDTRRPLATAPILVIAGICLAAAVGCRVSLAVAVAAIALLVSIRLIARLRYEPRAMLGQLLAFSLPLAAGAAALGWYNHVRFGSWMEFGQKYQLAGVNLRSYPSLFGIANVWPGLWSYFFRPVALTNQFPFIMAVSGNGTFPSFINLPAHYESYELISGLAWVMPILWLLPVAIAARRMTARRQRHECRQTSSLSLRERAGVRADGESATTANSGPASTVHHSDATWLTAVLLTAAILGFLPVLLMIGSSQRYLVDLTPALVIVTMLCLWRLSDLRKTKPKSSRRWLALGVSLAAVSVVLGVLIAMEGYAGHFRYFNPELFRKLSGGHVDGIPDANPYLSKNSSMERATDVEA